MTASALRSEYAAWMVDERGWSKETRRTRLTTMAQAASFFHARDRTLLSATREDVMAFISDTRHPRTRNRKLTDLKAFYRFAGERHYARADPTRAIDRISEPKNIPRPLTPSQAKKLLRGAVLVSQRAHMVVALLLYTGIRREECVELTWSNVDTQERFIRVVGKGSKEREIPLPAKLVPTLVAWRLQANSSAWVFPSSQAHGQPFSAITLWHDVKDAAAMAGLPLERAAPHALRHTFATELLDAGVDIRVVQVLLGHASLATTQIYTAVTKRRLRSDVDRLDFDS